MTPAREDWQAALHLLDEALDLPAAQWPGWIDRLAPAQAHLRPLLQQLLDDRRAIETGDFLQQLPPLQAAPAHGVGQRIGPWLLLRPLGEGGMASVWLARRADGAHGREVALKLPHRGAGARSIGERFLRERAILSTLDHPHIAAVLDAGSDDGQPWLALAYVDGVPITAYAASLDLRARLRLFLPVLQAVQHAHAQLVIHRDIKPANVLVTAAGSVQLLDFGVAKLLQADGSAAAETALTQQGGRAMTPQYASPEQVAGRPLGVASDVYALGVLLYELLTGRLPYRLQRDTAAALEEAILDAAVQPPSRAVADPRLARALRGDIDTIVMTALRSAPAQRYASAAALADDIERHLQSLPIRARPAGALLRLRKLWARRRLPLTAALVVGLAVAGGSGVALWQAGQAREQAQRAAAVQQFLLDIFKANSARQSDPEKARAATARDLLDLGAERVERDITAPPALRLTLLDTLRELYKDLGLEKNAAALARQAVAIARRESGVDSEAHLLQLTRLADVLADAAGNAERQRVVDEGLAIVARRPDRPTPARLLMQVEAAGLYQSSRLDDAEAASQRALADAQALADPLLLRRAFEVAGVTAQLRGDTAAAEVRLAEAVRFGEAAGQDRFDLVRARVQLADAQARRLHLDAAEASLRAALAYTLRVNVPGHIDTMQTRMRLAFTLHRAGRLHEALAEHQAVQAALDTAPTLDSFTFPLHASGYGQTLNRLGRNAEAEALLRRAIEVRDRTRGGTRVSAELREFLVHTMVVAGRLDEAGALLAEAAAIRQANGIRPGQRGWALQAVAALALARARGDATAARDALAALVPGSDTDAADSLGWIDGTLLRSRFEVEHGEAGPALARLQRLRGVLVAHQLAGRLGPLDGERLTLCAAIAGQQGAAAQAAALLARAHAVLAVELGPEAPLRRDWLATARALPPARAAAAEIDCD